MIGKTALFDAIAGTNRGLLASEKQKQAILAAIATLEDLNPTPLPVEAGSLLDGNWRLIYTTSKGLLNLDRLPFFKLGQIYQYIRVENTSVYNIAEIYGLPYLEGLVSVAAKFEPLSGRRVQVKFNRSIIGWQRLLSYNSPENFIQEIEAGSKFTAIDTAINSDRQQGWLDITYLDNDLRIGRGNEGSLFVLSKV
ncbi:MULTISPECIES: PAP/fibrillin family protein [unclassified Tolypothrix]|uniref:PAP/fibrillin family protein n=1 Tax=unclassified Tolypothrix TaxID=2649714 RepID=UPI0005EABA67|nr:MULTISPECIES: PAP/fibrillin family protein [unclassified Tolypothrix]BAY92274.1 PAP fibrillin family protein [Microchaete diplosiphon NIES-3275]EKE98452.1 PAP fibrillin family protein [Tolypothrix sp. PCC 7601]MBE9086511.1 PAP/fibrillin family protein [Tolypothrix sp. LEGE 11397]UYD26248.1 PAP/fibrillin family protein [Tolypothrix sp. PCC 7712]UYD31515.1 PAP/fibrillin family protein [Tolypothrix sp. PCC 7601]